MSSAAERVPLPELRAALEHLPDPVRVLTPDGEVLFVNRSACQQLPVGLGHVCDTHGVDEPLCPACRLAVTVREAEPARWHVAIDETVDGGPGGDESEAGEPPIKRFYEVTQWPINGTSAGGVSAVCELIRDVTISIGLEHSLAGEAARLEREIEENQATVGKLKDESETLRDELVALRSSQEELISRDRSLLLGQLVASLAHEIHTPLGVVLSNTSMLNDLAEKLRADIPAAEKPVGLFLRSTSLTRSAGERIEMLVRSLKSFARLDEGDHKRVDLHEGLDAVVTLLEHRSGRHIELVRDYGELPGVVCRPEAINQVFFSLLANAIDAIPGEGRVTVRTCREGDQVRVDVEDNGTGIAPEHEKRIFEPGFSTKPRGRGAGIGLAIARRIVCDHGGQICFRTEPGCGTRFTVTLPEWHAGRAVSPSARASTAIPPDPAGPHGSSTGSTQH